MPAWQVGVAQCHRRDPSDLSDRLHKGFIPYSLLTLLKSEGSNKHRLCAPAQIQSLSVNISKSFSQSLKKKEKADGRGSAIPCHRAPGSHMCFGEWPWCSQTPSCSSGDPPSNMSLLKESNKEKTIDSGHCRPTRRSAAHTKAWPQFHFSHKASQSTVEFIRDIFELCEMEHPGKLLKLEKGASDAEQRAFKSICFTSMVSYFLFNFVVLLSPVFLCSSWFPTAPVSHQPQHCHLRCSQCFHLHLIPALV